MFRDGHLQVLVKLHVRDPCLVDGRSRKLSLPPVFGSATERLVHAGAASTGVSLGAASFFSFFFCAAGFFSSSPVDDGRAKYSLFDTAVNVVSLSLMLLAILTVIFPSASSWSTFFTKASVPF